MVILGPGIFLYLYKLLNNIWWYWVPGFSSVYINFWTNIVRLRIFLYLYLSSNETGMYETGGCAGNPIESFFRWATENNTTPGLVQEQDYPYNPKEYRIIGPFIIYLIVLKQRTSMSNVIIANLDDYSSIFRINCLLYIPTSSLPIQSKYSYVCWTLFHKKGCLVADKNL